MKLAGDHHPAERFLRHAAVRHHDIEPCDISYHEQAALGGYYEKIADIAHFSPYYDQCHLLHREKKRWLRQIHKFYRIKGNPDRQHRCLPLIY